LLKRATDSHFSIVSEAENIFERMSESISEGIIMVDNDDVILHVNDSFCQIVGYSKTELSGKIAHEILTVADNKSVVEEKIKRRKTGISEEYELSVNTKDGRIILLTIKGFPLKNEKGKIIGSVGIHKDITKGKETQERLINALEQRNNILSNIREAFFSVDGINGKPLLLSEAYKDVYGYPVSAFYANPKLWFEVIHPDDKKIVEQSLKEIVKGKTVNDEYRIIRQNGEIIWVEGKVAPTLNERGELIRIDGVVADISKRKEAELERNQKINELSTFINKVSHDLRAPLSSLLGLITITEMNASASDINRYFEMMKSSVQQMDQLLKDLLSLVYTSEGTVAASEINFQQLVESIKAGLEYMPGFAGIDFKLVQDSVLPFKTDKRFLTTILQNFISNSIKYRTPHGPAFIHIKINSENQGVKIEVCDNGIGIPKEIHEKIFEMFFRGTEISSGTGLGLYISKSAVEKLGGKIELKSAAEKGSIFSIYLPSIQ
jgi:PAS domain S-box-containing protein